MARKAFVTCDSCERALTLSCHYEDPETEEQLVAAKWFIVNTPDENLDLCSPACLLTWATSHQPKRKPKTSPTEKGLDP